MVFHLKKQMGLAVRIILKLKENTVADVEQWNLELHFKIQFVTVRYSICLYLEWIQNTKFSRLTKQKASVFEVKPWSYINTYTVTHRN